MSESRGAARRATDECEPQKGRRRDGEEPHQQRAHAHAQAQRAVCDAWRGRGGWGREGVCRTYVPGGPHGETEQHELGQHDLAGWPAGNGLGGAGSGGSGGGAPTRPRQSLDYESRQLVP